MMLALSPNTSPVTEKEMSDQIEDLPYVKSVTLHGQYPSGGHSGGISSVFHHQPAPHEELFENAHLHKDKTESDQAFKGADEIQSIIQTYYPQGSLSGGETPSTQDIKPRSRTITTGSTTCPCWACSWW